jgi:hypothetical protein
MPNSNYIYIYIYFEMDMQLYYKINNVVDFFF